MTGAPNLTMDRLDTTEEERGGDVPPVGFDLSCMSIVTDHDLTAGDTIEPDPDEKPVVQWAESLVTKAVAVRQALGACPAQIVRTLVVPAEQKAQGAIELISSPDKRDELMGRLTGRMA